MNQSVSLLVCILVFALVVPGCKKKEEAPPVKESSQMAQEAAPAEKTEPAMEPSKESAPETAEGGNGKEVYDQVCSTCHAEGVAGAPKLGDHAAWEERIAKGMETLYDHSLNGFEGQTGVMPAKGGNAALSDEDVKAAVDYMVEHSK